MHVHLSALNGFITFLYALIFFGLMRLLALRYPSHPLSQAVRELY